MYELNKIQLYKSSINLSQLLLPIKLSSICLNFRYLFLETLYLLQNFIFPLVLLAYFWATFVLSGFYVTLVASTHQKQQKYNLEMIICQWGHHLFSLKEVLVVQVFEGVEVVEVVEVVEAVGEEVLLFVLLFFFEEVVSYHKFTYSLHIVEPLSCDVGKNRKS